MKVAAIQMPTVEDKTEKFDIVSDALIKRIELLGKNAIKFLENKMGTDGNVADMAKNMLEQKISRFMPKKKAAHPGRQCLIMPENIRFISSQVRCRK